MRRRNKSLTYPNYPHGTPAHPVRFSSVTGAIPWLNPTRVQIQTSNVDGQGWSDETKSPQEFQVHKKISKRIAFQWTSRNNRKGIHLLLISPNQSIFQDSVEKQYLSQKCAVAQGLLRMVTHFPLWDLSYLLSLMYLLGSSAWALNGVIALMPHEEHKLAFAARSSFVGAVTGFPATILFVMGSFIMLIEAINAYRGYCFGWMVSQLSDPQKNFKSRVRPGGCQHEHFRLKDSIYRLERTHYLPFPGFVPRKVKDNALKNSSHKGFATGSCLKEQFNTPKKWRFLPTYHELFYHFIYEIGFLASVIQHFSSIVFLISNVARLATTETVLPTKISIVFLWTPKFVGSVGFVVAGFLFMLETQETWFRPVPRVLGWHIGFFNFLGGVGFFLASCFSVVQSSSWAQYQSSVATIWASGAFMVSSFLAWFESLRKYTIQVDDLAPTDLEQV